MIAVRSPSPSSMRASRKYDAMLNRSGNCGPIHLMIALFALALQVRLVRHEQALDGPIVNKMLVDDLVDVVGRHVSIPDLLGVHHDRTAVLALVEAAGGVGAHARL